jgi:two-component system nitrogen regulation response regulator NtrX
VGGTRTIQVDVRVLAATNKDLAEEINKNKFREDLYFRLNVIPIRVPPLRERVEDIPALVKEFLREMSLRTNIEEKKMSKEAVNILQKYNWPGNVRELKNLVERLVIMTPAQEIEAKYVPPPFNKSSEVKSDLETALMHSSLKAARSEFEKAFIEHKLREFNGNITKTAEAIGIERSSLHKKINAYGLNGFRTL